MLPSPSFTSLRSSATNEFNSLRSRASVNSWLMKIFQRQNSPRSLVTTSATGLTAQRLAGVQHIPVDQIIGTIQRSHDFDKDFRPLKRHLRDRWVSALLRFNTEGWQPIEVHKVGEFYYVKDGHHRVSVAKSLGMMFIDAEVWDHCVCQPRPTTFVRSSQPTRKQTEACVANI